MQYRWEYLTLSEFKKLAREEQVCILPIGSLERHGEHMPFGTDTINAHNIACRAAEKEPCVVFPPYWFGQVHEAACFTGTINFPTEMLVKMLEVLLDQIAQNGFKKILLVSSHGGNRSMLEFFNRAMLEKQQGAATAQPAQPEPVKTAEAVKEAAQETVEELLQPFTEEA